MFPYKNVYRVDGNICYIDCFSRTGKLTGTIIIDSYNVPIVNKYNWHIKKSRRNIFYAQASLDTSTIRMHRLLVPNSIQVDHINHNGLDNRMANLRACNNAENNRNKPPYKRPKSGYTGIRYNPKANSYYVRIMVDKKEISLGAYKNIEEAIEARKKGEEKYFGNFRYKEE